MAFPESILLYQQTTAKALNQTHTQLKIASSISHPFLWRREEKAHVRASPNASQELLIQLSMAGGTSRVTLPVLLLCLSSGSRATLPIFCLGLKWGTELRKRAQCGVSWHGLSTSRGLIGSDPCQVEALLSQPWQFTGQGRGIGLNASGLKEERLIKALI